MAAAGGWRYLRLYSSKAPSAAPWSSLAVKCMSSAQISQTNLTDAASSESTSNSNSTLTSTEELVQELLADAVGANVSGQSGRLDSSFTQDGGIHRQGHFQHRDSGLDVRPLPLNSGVGMGSEVWPDRGRYDTDGDVRYTDELSPSQRQLERQLEKRRERSERALVKGRFVDEDKSRTSFRATGNEYYLSGLPYDESPARLHEAMCVAHLWRQSFEEPDRVWDDLMKTLSDNKLWEFVYRHLAGAVHFQEVRALKKQGAALERGLKDLRNAVIGGRFQWQGEAGVVIHGTLRNALQTREARADLEDAKENKDDEFLASIQHRFQDKMVEHALRIVLEPVFEPSFANNSHGFRPGRSQFTAFGQIRAQFQNCNWYFRSNLRTLYDVVINDRAVFRDKLKAILAERISDVRFLELLMSGIDSEAVMGCQAVSPSEPGVSPLSSKSGIVPLLCNIYFNDFDIWLKKQAAGFNKGATRRLNPERLAHLRDSNLKLAQQTPILDPFDPHFKRMAFCRYADDFIVAFGSPRSDAVAMVEDIYEFLDKDLHTPPPEDANLVNIMTKDVHFLGHLLRKRLVTPEKEERRRVLKAHAKAIQERWKSVKFSADAQPAREGEAGRDVAQLEHVPVVDSVGQVLCRDDLIRASIRRVLSIDADIDKLVRLLARAGFCHKNGEPIPNFRYMHCTQSETNEAVRKMLFGLCDYLRAAGNRQRVVHYLSNVLRHSLAKMFAAKFKLTSRRKVFKRGGKSLAGWIKAGKPPIGKVDDVDESRLPREGRDVLAAIPFVRGSQVPKPDVSHLPNDWEPRLIQDLKSRVCRPVGGEST